MKYQVKDPQGTLHIIEGPEGASPDQIISQAQKLIPSSSKPQGLPDWKGVVGEGIKNAFMQPGTVARKLATDPVAQAKVLPTLAATAGGISPIPGGATMGTALGQGLRDAALATYGKKDQIPGVMQHGLELGVSALGDIAAIPALKRAHYGSEIGKAEQASGVITRAPTRAVTPGSVGETLNNLEAQLDAGTIKTAQEAKDAKAVISQIYKNPKIYEQTGEIKVQAMRVSRKVQDLMNKSIPGRVGPATALSKSQVIPNSIKKGYMSLPWALRHGAEGAIGASAGWQLIKKMMGQ